MLYQAGLGVRENDIEAVRLFRLAANQKDPRAQYLLCVMYGYGVGVEYDSAPALEWIRLAAGQQVRDAQSALGLLSSLRAGGAEAGVVGAVRAGTVGERG